MGCARVDVGRDESLRVVRRVANFVQFIGEGRGSRALADALLTSEHRRDEIKAELELLRRGQEAIGSLPPLVWIEERVSVLQEVLERRTERSALLLRALVGKIRLEPVANEGIRPYYRAVSKLQVLALLDVGLTPEDPESGSTSLKWWTRSQGVRTSAEIPFETIRSRRRPQPIDESRWPPGSCAPSRYALPLAFRAHGWRCEFGAGVEVGFPSRHKLLDLL